MKKLILFTLFIFIALNAVSQINYGIRGGVSSSDFKADEIRTEDFDVSSLKERNMGFHGGLVVQVNFFNLFLQPELLISTATNDLKVEDLSDGSFETVNQHFTKLDFPVLFGRRFGPLRIGVGPVGTVMLNQTSELENITGYKEKFNTATFGYQVGAGIDILDFIGLDVRYEGNLSRLGSGMVVGGQEREFDSRASQFIFSAAVYF